METRLNGLNFFYTDTGPSSQPTVVFVHAFPFDHTMWQPQVELLKSTHRVITYDHRGQGQSDVGDGQYSVEFLVDDFFALLDTLKVQKATVIGLSMGGYVALRAIERDASRFQALVLCDTRSEADSNEAKIKRSGAVKTVKTKGVPEYAEGFLKAAFAPENFQSIPTVVEAARQMILANSVLGICGTLFALGGRTDTTAALEGIKVPTLILVGEKDGITPPSAAEAMHAKIPNSHYFTIPQAGHLSNLENPRVFNAHLQKFLQHVLQ